MITSLSTNTAYQLVTFHPAYENVHALLAEIHLYVFDPDGRLLASQAVRRDKVTVALEAAGGESREAVVVVSPPLENTADDPLTLAVARSHFIFEAEMLLDRAQASYALPPVPEVIWRWWLVHSLWQNVRAPSGKITGLLAW